MLSPASLRVCCLAVMAPALTKADRQAGCLPVVLSDSFCVHKTSDTYNIKGRIGENRLKCAYTYENNHSTSNKRKPFMHRACWRTQKSGTAFICRYRTVSNDSSKSLLYTNRVRTQRETRFKTWQSTNATTAYAGKIKLKYTMNKNTSNIRNMGLAKANTSLGLQSVRKVKRFSKENQSSGPINVMEDSLNFSDSTDSPVQIEPLITDITNSESDVSPVDNTVPCVNNNERTSAQGILNTVTDTVNEKAVSESVLKNDSEPFVSSAGADVIEAMDTSNASVTLTDLLSSTFENLESTKNSPLTSESALPCPVHNTGSSAADSSAIDTEVPDVQESSEVLQPQVHGSTLETSQQSETTDLPSECDIIPLQPLISKQMSNSIFLNCMGKLQVCKYLGSPVKTSSLFSVFNSSKLLTNVSKLPYLRDKKPNCPVITENRFGSEHLIPVRQEKNACCIPPSQELESLESMLIDKAPIVSTVLTSSSRLLQKHLSSHIKKQISSLVEHYQRKFQIPCQRPAKHVSSKPNKDLLDLKAELLQSEDVKNMSTAALVSLVRKLESSGSQTRMLTPKTALSSNIPDISESTTLCFDPDDCMDIKHTSGILLSALKDVLKSSDPYMTDFSEEESDSESDEEETVSESEATDNTSALWNYMTQRTKLGSRSTWLLARVHELEFRIKEYNERWNELVKAEGSVCFEEPASSQNSSSILESDEISYSVKQNIMKNFFLPLNGFLDRTDASHIVKSASETLQPELEDGLNPELETETCCRVRPLNIGSFRKRKIVFMPGLHTTNPKFPRISTVNCTCNSQSELAPCILCTGQYHSTQSVDPESMALRDRVSILDSYFHPALSTEKDIPLGIHLENILKTEAKYQKVRQPSPEPNTESDVQQGIKPKYSDLRSHRKLSRYARSLSAKYRNKHHRNTKHLRKHKLVFGKWRRLHNKHTLRARNRFRRHSIASSGSSPDSPAHSPLSIFDDGYEKKRRDDSQFDIDDVIIPCNSKSGRLVEIQYKEIMIPSWRSLDDESLKSEVLDAEEEVFSESFFTKRHDLLEVEEKEKVKRTGLGLGLNKRARRNRCDSRADSSGANTPDPTSLYNNQDNVFQTPNFNISASPLSPASPPATPNSAVVSDDSQPPFGSGSSCGRTEKKKINLKRTIEETTTTTTPPPPTTTTRSAIDFDEVLPYELHQFPLTDETYEELLAENDHYKEIYDMPSNTSSFPASPISSSSSTSTVEDDDDDDEDDITDPEWTVVKPMRNGPEQALVLKFAKR